MAHIHSKQGCRYVTFADDAVEPRLASLFNECELLHIDLMSEDAGDVLHVAEEEAAEAELIDQQVFIACWRGLGHSILKVDRGQPLPRLGQLVRAFYKLHAEAEDLPEGYLPVEIYEEVEDAKQ